MSCFRISQGAAWNHRAPPLELALANTDTLWRRLGVVHSVSAGSYPSSGTLPALIRTAPKKRT